MGMSRSLACTCKKEPLIHTGTRADTRTPHNAHAKYARTHTHTYARTHARTHAHIPVPREASIQHIVEIFVQDPVVDGHVAVVLNGTQRQVPRHLPQEVHELRACGGICA